MSKMEEVEAEMQAHQICQRVYELEDCPERSSLGARELAMERDDLTMGHITGLGLINKFFEKLPKFRRGPLLGATTAIS